MELTKEFFRGGNGLQPYNVDDPNEANVLNWLKKLHADASATRAPLKGSATWNPADLADGAGEAKVDFKVIGAKLRDFAIAAHGADVGGLLKTAYVGADEVAAVVLQNETTASKNVASATTKVGVIPLALAVQLGIVGTLTWNPADALDGVGETSSSVAVVGAALGDFAIPSFSLDLQALMLTAYVDAADSAKGRLQNESTGTVNLGSGTLSILVLKPSQFPPHLLGSKVYNPASLLDGAGVSVDVPLPAVKVGDACVCSFTKDLQGILMTVNCNADGVATVRFQNETTGTINLDEGTIAVGVLPEGAGIGMTATIKPE